ncbi:MAG: [Clostridia bacterium]|nr:[FeFe] hydrogenase H-cluster maturation GTPase HydF [Clostridia bacterium]
MSLNETPKGERIHIGFFGQRNVGKSSLVNKITGQNLSVVSDVLGTTTDPVLKSMELLPLGPVTIIDTPGFDDEGVLGELRVTKTREILAKTDIAVLVIDAQKGIRDLDKELILLFEERKIPYIKVFNKSDLKLIEGEISVSCESGEGIEDLKRKIAELKPEGEKKQIVSDVLKKGSVAVLVTPIDESAPKGRLILPQQQTIRDLLDAGNTAFVCREHELEKTLNGLKNPPDAVITDSQAFGFVSKIVPESVPLTSFSILFARYKGVLETAVKGASVLDKLSEGDKILISEGCTHHRQCGDIGTVKLPAMIKKKTGKNFNFEFTSGGTFPEDLSEFSLVVHCGGCMLNEREMQSRLKKANEQKIPMTNYGILIAHINGILKRSLSLFPDIRNLIE